MKRRAYLYLGFAVVAAAAKASAREGRFTFRLPEGFKKPSDVTGPEGVVPDDLVESARNLDSFGVALAGGEVVATFGALEQTGTPRLPTTLADVKTLIARMPALQGATAVSCTTPTIANVPCSRFELDFQRTSDAWPQLIYMLPGGDSWANLRIACARAHYDRLAPTLDALVSTLPGIAPQIVPERPESNDERTARFGGAIGGGALLGMLLRSLLVRKRKRKA